MLRRAVDLEAAGHALASSGTKVASSFGAVIGCGRANVRDLAPGTINRPRPRSVFCRDEPDYSKCLNFSRAFAIETSSSEVFGSIGSFGWPISIPRERKAAW